MKKKFIAIDCDGVLTNGFLEKILVPANELSGQKLTVKDFKKDIRAYYPDHFDQVEREFVLAPGFVNSFEPYEEAQEFVQWLRSNDYAFKFVTSVYHDHPTWQYERQLWLERHFKATRQDVVFCKDKSFVPSETLIDDLDHNAIDWMRAQQKTAILFKTPQNENVEEKFDLIQPFHLWQKSQTFIERESPRNILGFTERGIMRTNDWPEIKEQIHYIMK